MGLNIDFTWLLFIPSHRSDLNKRCMFYKYVVTEGLKVVSLMGLGCSIALASEADRKLKCTKLGAVSYGMMTQSLIRIT
jgi:hypothetical protein